MKSRTFIAFLSFFFFLPSSFAGSCRDTLNLINSDITKYQAKINQQKLAWMNLNWLQDKLGMGDKEKNDNGSIDYKWQCSETYRLKVTVNKQKKPYYIVSEYSNNSGAGQLSACLIEDCSNPDAPMTMHEEVVKPKMDKVPISQAANVAETPGTLGPGNVCTETVTQVLALSKIDNPQASLPYPWEDIAWIQSQMGQPKTQSTPRGEAAAWECSNKKDSLLFIKSPDGTVTISGVQCPTENCTIGSVQRNGSILRGNVMQIRKSGKV